MAIRVRRQTETAESNILTSSSQILRGAPRETYAIQYRDWQNQLWAYRATVGEYMSVTNWLAAGFSRIRLKAAIWEPGADEPTIIEEGPAADIVNELRRNAVGGESQFMRLWGLHLTVPGVGWMVATENANGRRSYAVKSADVIRRSAKTAINAFGEEVGTYDIQEAPDVWRNLGANSLCVRIYDPDPRYDFLPTSVTQATLPTLKEIDLYNRAITATLMSRIAFNGILFIPTEATIPVNPEFKDSKDPFIAEFLEFASRGIKDPGSPGSVIPFPMRVSEVHIEKFRHLLLSSGLDPKIIEARESAVKRLSEQLPAPPEAMTGISDMNHWNASTATEENLKIYFSPPAELLCGGLTSDFLIPMLEAGNKPIDTPSGGRHVIWYDLSELSAPPDNSENATHAHESNTISDDAYLRVVGLDENDKPNEQQLRQQILVSLATKGAAVPDSYKLLFPGDVAALDAMTPVASESTPDAVGPSSEEKDATGNNTEPDDENRR